MENLQQHIDKAIIFFLIYTFTFVIFFKTIGYTLPFVLAFILSIVFQKPTKWLIKKFKLSVSIASLITTTVFSAIIILITILSIASITNEIISLTKNAQSYVSYATPKINTFIKNLESFYKNLDPSISNTIESNFSDYASKTVSATMNVSGKFMSFVWGLVSYVPYVVMVVIFTFVSTYFFTKDFSSAKNKFIKMLPSGKSDRFFEILQHVKKMLANYVLSELIVIAITFVETLIAYALFGISYGFLLAVITAVCDILPIIGIGIIYFPLAIIYFLMGNYLTAVELLIAYAFISVVRQIIEPKIVSSTMGIHPVAALAALFIGLEAGGVEGIFFCMFLVLFYKMFKNIGVL
ncbi:MAG: sporulation integral membrane protein YtvI [Clostridium sp.]|nr:sporulation integral membrane protein YtvI [Clostridium sp.]